MVERDTVMTMTTTSVKWNGEENFTEINWKKSKRNWEKGEMIKIITGLRI